MENWKGGARGVGARAGTSIGGTACGASGGAGGGAGPERADCDAPGELLAEFLSAIMRRQYAEALRCCRLILHYEPHNATARGFYPLLQHRLRAAAAAEAAAPSEAAAGAATEATERGGEWSPGSRSSSRADSADWAGSQSSLELDSSPASRSPSRRAGLTDSGSGGSGAEWGASSASGLSASVSASEGSAGPDADADDNGNPPAPSIPHTSQETGDVQNDNAGAAPHPENIFYQKLELRR